MDCPFCNCETTVCLDDYENSEKWHCYTCGNDFIVWYDEKDNLVAITDRHNQEI